MRYSNIPTMVARYIIAAVTALFDTLNIMPDNDTLLDYLTTIIRKAEKECRFPMMTDEHNFFRACALALSTAYRAALGKKFISVLQYIELFAAHKEMIETKLNDHGAFGDLCEILVRIASVKNLHLVQPAHLYVKPEGKQDIRINGVSYEVGTNGKTWAQGLPGDAMYGDFTGVIYGVFDREVKDQIYLACQTGDIDMAISAVKSYMGIWDDKYHFAADMASLYKRGGKAFAVKSCKVMSQYHEIFHNSFISAIEDEIFETLGDRLDQ